MVQYRVQAGEFKRCFKSCVDVGEDLYVWIIYIKANKDGLYTMSTTFGGQEFTVRAKNSEIYTKPEELLLAEMRDINGPDIMFTQKKLTYLRQSYSKSPLIKYAVKHLNKKIINWIGGNEQ